MKKRINILLVLFLIGSTIFAHTINYGDLKLREWTQIQSGKKIEGSFYMMKNNEVYIEDAKGTILHYPLSSLSKADQVFAIQKNDWVSNINSRTVASVEQAQSSSMLYDLRYWIAASVLLAFTIFLFKYTEKDKLKYLVPALVAGVSAFLFSFAEKAALQLESTTNPLTIDSAFAPFKPNVFTHWDGTYFYIESNGIPEHQMMVGITSWQQQVPISQCYNDTNAWMVPLNPVVADTPVPVNPSHFLRGAVAIAANGVPIFNPYTNTGVDAFLDGQLDNWGGHCGRADDYHYHIAPLHLYSHTRNTLPIAYALDGYAIYGAYEPEGGAMSSLDGNHGHIGANGVYHYHGTSSAPYMIGKMVGRVTEDGTMQIIPQPHANPIRPAGTPLRGAVITDCQPNGTGNGYVLTYHDSAGLTHKVDYFWSDTGTYNFKFINPTDSNSRVYRGFFQCEVPFSSSIRDINSDAGNILIFPNPTHDLLYLKLQNDTQEKDVREITIYNLNGEVMYKSNRFKQNIDIRNMSQGTYIVNIQLSKGTVNKKMIVQ